MENFSAHHDFVNTVGNGLLELNPSELKEAAEIFKIKPNEHVEIYNIAEASGRTKGAVEIGLSELPLQRYVGIRSSTTKDNPGRNIYETLKKLEDRCDRMIILAASQSGKKMSINKEANRAIKFKEESKKNNSDILYLTGSPDGEVARKFKEHGASILKIKGTEGIPEKDFERGGFLGDAGEVETAYVVGELAKEAYNAGSMQSYYDNMRRHFQKLGRNFDSKKSLLFFDKFGDAFSRDTTNVILGVAGSSLSDAETIRVRMDHINKGYFKRNSTHEMGGDHHCDPPMPGNNLLAISQSGGNVKVWSGGETSPVLPFYQMAKDRGTNNFCIVGEKGAMTDITPPGHYLLLPKKLYGQGYFPQDVLMAGAVGAIETVKHLMSKGVISDYDPQIFKNVHHLG